MANSVTNLENLAEILANLGVSTSNIETNKRSQIIDKSNKVYQSSNKGTNNLEDKEFEIHYVDGIVKEVDPTLEYNEKTGTIKQHVLVTCTSNSGKKKDFVGIRTLKNAKGNIKESVKEGQMVTLLCKCLKIDENYHIFIEIIDKRDGTIATAQKISEEYTANKILYKGNLSEEEQINAHNEAVLKSKKALEKAGYDCSRWILNEENDSLGFWQSYSQVCGCIKNPQGKDIDIVVKSAKGGKIHLSPTDLDLLVANKHNILMVWDGTTAHSITNEELFGQNLNINLIFDTKNTPYEYYSALSGFFKYIKGTTFVIENPKHNVYYTIKSFGLDVKQEGKQDSLTEEAL